MDELFAEQAVLIEALTEVAELLALMRVIGLDTSGIELDARRLAGRLRAINRKIDDGPY